MLDPRMKTQRMVSPAADHAFAETMPLPARVLLCTSCWYATERAETSECPACGRPAPAAGWPAMPYPFRNRYTLTDQVECTATAAVFRALPFGATTGPQVVVKVARGDGTPDSVSVAKKAFRREARVADALSDESPAFLGLRGRDDDDPAYIALEQVSWPTLEGLLAQSGALPPQEVARIGVAILSAVSCLEKQRLVHGNLVPRNIHVHRQRDESYEVKIAGAGSEPPKPETPALSPKIFHAYMSPEQWSGDAPSTASDIYAVASVLWELVAGDVPHPPSDHPISSAKRLSELRGDLTRPDALPKDLYAILARALSFDSAHRRFPLEDGARSAAASLAASFEGELRRFLSETSQHEENARQGLEEMSNLVATVRERLTPIAKLIARAEELDAALRRLRDPSEGKPTLPKTTELRQELRELRAAVDAELSEAPAIRTSGTSQPKNVLPREEDQNEEDDATRSPSEGIRARWRLVHLLPALGAALAGFLIGLGMGRSGRDDAAPPSPHAAETVRQEPITVHPTAVPPANSATNSAVPSVDPATSGSVRVEPADLPSSSPSTSAAPAPSVTSSAPPRTGTVPHSDPYETPVPVPKPAPKPQDDPY